MQKSLPGLVRILDELEKHYGMQSAVGPSEPYEMILFVNCGYPATDVSCTKGYEPLKAGVGTKPDQTLKAPREKLAKLTQAWGNVPGVARGTIETGRANRKREFFWAI
jgi:hypothetical protein